MINSDKKMTLENEFLKNFILNNYDSKTISVAYGNFYTINGFFSLGKKTTPNGIFKYAFFLHDINGNKCVDLEKYNDEKKLKECLMLVGLIANKTEQAFKKEVKGKNKPQGYKQISIFDLLEV